jgi:hypothetical protein
MSEVELAVALFSGVVMRILLGAEVIGNESSASATQGSSEQSRWMAVECPAGS